MALLNKTLQCKTLQPFHPGTGAHLRCEVDFMTQLEVMRQASARRATSPAWMPGSSALARRASTTGPTTISPAVKCRTYSFLRQSSL